RRSRNESSSSGPAYHPMTAVAGDFYDFVPVDKNRVGFLIADVSGHGVPAALIASMIKGAMQSVEPCARDPQGVLHGFNRTLSRQVREQLVFCRLSVARYRRWPSAVFFSRASSASLLA